MANLIGEIATIKHSCVKCGLETTEGLYALDGTIPFCGWCYQKLLGELRQDEKGGIMTPLLDIGGTGRRA